MEKVGFCQVLSATWLKMNLSFTPINKHLKYERIRMLSDKMSNMSIISAGCIYDNFVVHTKYNLSVLQSLASITGWLFFVFCFVFVIMLVFYFVVAERLQEDIWYR